MIELVLPNEFTPDIEHAATKMQHLHKYPSIRTAEKEEETKEKESRIEEGCTKRTNTTTN
jgi:hypothetical protein